MRSGRPSDGTPMLNGAQALIRTLVDAGVTTCFTNPGTSEMHFVSALDTVPQMRAILTLFEGVATGAADGYARMADRPAATLLHLGPGLGNGLANLHNARKAEVPIVNIVGDHATYHVAYDAQLQSDIETVARNVSTWVRTAKTTADLGRDAVEAVAAANGPPGQVATLILPADVSWEDGAAPAAPLAPSVPSTATAEVVEVVATALRSGEPTAILLGGRALREASLRAAARIAATCDAKVYAEVFPARMQRGAGLPSVERLAYFAELATVQLGQIKHLVLVDAKAPVVVFRVPRQAELSGARRLPSPRTRRRQWRCGLEPGSACRQALRRRCDAESCSSLSGRSHPSGRSPRRKCAKRSGPCSLRGPSFPTRPKPPG